MTEQRLPKLIEPERLAQSRSMVSGALAITAMSRLANQLADAGGEVQVQLEFGIDVEGLVFVKGDVAAQLVLRCQRCLGDMALPVTVQLALSPVEHERQSRALPSHYEALITRAEPVNLSDMIEDELLLALPIVPMHSKDECTVTLDKPQVDDSTQAAPPRKQPFANLDSLIKAKQTNS